MNDTDFLTRGATSNSSTAHRNTPAEREAARRCLERHGLTEELAEMLGLVES